MSEVASSKLVNGAIPEPKPDKKDKKPAKKQKFDEVISLEET